MNNEKNPQLRGSAIFHDDECLPIIIKKKQMTFRSTTV